MHFGAPTRGRAMVETARDKITAYLTGKPPRTLKQIVAALSLDGVQSQEVGRMLLDRLLVRTKTKRQPFKYEVVK